MDGDHTVMVEILNAIEHGTLSVDETRRRLEDIIEKEIEKTDAPANFLLVEECEKLLWEINTNGKLPFISHLKENHSAFLRHSRQQRNIQNIKKYLFRIGTVAASLGILSIALEAFLHQEWLSTSTTSDGEQLIISGEVIEPGLIETGNADGNEQANQFFTTTNLDEATEFLGVDFGIPDHPAGDWIPSHYDCRKTKRKTELLGYYYLSNTQTALTINAYLFSDIQNAYIEYEQNREGSTCEYHGITLYLSENIDKTQCMWMYDSTIYIIDGQIELSDALKIVNQIMGE